MPFTTIDNTRIYYRLEGNADKPVLVLSHSLGADHGMWNPQVPQLLDYFRLLRYDTRGHGASDASPGDYTIELLARDAIALTDALGIAQFAFCGLSLGGMTGQWIAARAPGRITRLVLANTSAKFPDPSVMETRRQTVLTGGMKPIEDSVMQRFFMKASLEGGDPHIASARTTLLATNPVGYAGCCAAVRDLDTRDMLGRIQCPTLIIAGDHDMSTPFAGHGELLAAGIAGSKVVHLPTAHLSNLERPRSFSSALLDFLVDERPPGEAEDRAVLREALSHRPIDPARRDYIIQHTWGAGWTRPGLDVRTRRLLTLTALALLGQWEEFCVHLRAGFAHELEDCDVREALLHAEVYSGAPCANAGLRLAYEELRKEVPR